MFFALPPAPEPWFVYSRRLERREGNCAFLWDHSLEPALSLEQWAQPGPALPGRLHCSAPGFIFVRVWSGGGGDQVTVPEERLASPVLPPCVHMSVGAGSREQAGMKQWGWAGRGCPSPWDPFSWMSLPWRPQWERGCSLSVGTTDAAI